MKKKLVVVTLVVLVALLMATPALAAGPQYSRVVRPARGSRQPVGPGLRLGLGGQQVFALVGTISSVDAGTRSLTVAVYQSNRLARASEQSVTVYTTDATRFLQWTESGGVPIGFEDLVVGNSVSVNGTVVDGQFVARRVTMSAPCVP
jgi:hypothetical protein